MSNTNDRDDIVKIGDLFRCKRRNHLVEVLNISYDFIRREYAWYLNTRGARVKVPTSRLLSRFERIKAPAALPAASSSAPVPASDNLTQTPA